MIADYAARGEPIPKNGSDEALHADHVYELRVDQLRATFTVDEWHDVLAAARTVVVVTAKENYALEKLERSGIRGPAKYEAAGITWAGQVPAFLHEASED